MILRCLYMQLMKIQRSRKADLVFSRMKEKEQVDLCWQKHDNPYFLLIAMHTIGLLCDFLFTSSKLKCTLSKKTLFVCRSDLLLSRKESRFYKGITANRSWRFHTHSFDGQIARVFRERRVTVTKPSCVL